MKNANNKYFLGLEGELIEGGGKSLIKMGFIGCGSHAFRNIFPCLQYLPVDLVAVCDTNKKKGGIVQASIWCPQNLY